MNENPYELMYMSHMGDEHAQQALFLQYQWLIDTLVNNSTNIPFLKEMKEDIIQEARIALYNAANSYRCDLMASFKTYATVVIQRRIWNLVRTYKIGAAETYFETISLDSLLAENLPVYEVIEQKDSLNNPEYYFQYHVAQENLNHFFQTLNRKEKETVDDWLSGKRYEEIARQRQITVKAYDGRLRRVRKKMHTMVLGDKKKRKKS